MASQHESSGKDRYFGLYELGCLVSCPSSSFKHRKLIFKALVLSPSSRPHILHSSSRPISPVRPTHSPNPTELTHSTPDDGVDITCWSAAEAEAALIATSIPVLRAFVRDKATSGGGYGSRGVDQVPLSRIGASRTEATGSRKAGNDIWVSAHGGRSGDADSDKSILREEQQGFPESGILQTNIFMIDTQSDAESAGRRGS